MVVPNHFVEAATGVAEEAGRYVDVSAISPIQPIPGIDFQPVLGSRMLANFVTFAPHTEAPEHSHPEEQIVVVLDGEFEFSIAGEKRIMRRGDVAVVPAWVRHGARTFDSTCRELDMFAPPRASLVDYARDVVVAD